MYPRLSDIFRDLLGFEFPIPIYSFGAMVAVAVIVAAWLTSLELQRMHAIGRIGSVRIQTKDPKKKRTREQDASPAELIGTITTIAIVMGVIGAKVFHILENLDQFFADPLGMIFSTGGLTFYGGLIFAGVAIAWYVRKKGVPVGAVADAVGAHLKRLSRHHQVLVVTHSPQVAAKADDHWVISKTQDEKTVTEVTILDGTDQRREEIARMLSGQDIPEEARAAAAKLIGSLAA